MLSLEFVPFVWEMACSRCVDFVGLVVLVVVCAVMVAVRYGCVCASDRVCAGSCVCWFMSCPVVVAYAVEHTSVVTWLWCLLTLVVVTSSLRSGAGMALILCMLAPCGTPAGNCCHVPTATVEEGHGNGE